MKTMNLKKNIRKIVDMNMKYGYLTKKQIKSPPILYNYILCISNNILNSQ